MSFRLLGLLMLSIASIGPAKTAAAQTGPIVAGQDYTIIESAAPASGERIEVIEAFAYTCPACAAVQTHVDAWKARLPDDVEFSYVPVVWGGVAEHFARAFFAAEVLGVHEQTHNALFNALHVERRQFRGEDDIAGYVAEQGGISKDDVLATMKSFAVTTRINRTRQQLQRFGVDGTPNFVVAGKYRIKPGPGGHARMMQVVDHVIELERRARAN